MAIIRIVHGLIGKYVILHEEPWLSSASTSIVAVGEILILQPPGQPLQSFTVEQVIRDETRSNIYCVVAKGELTGAQIQALREAMPAPPPS